MAWEPEDFLVDGEDVDTENFYKESVAVLEFEDTHRGEKLGAQLLGIQMACSKLDPTDIPIELGKEFQIGRAGDHDHKLYFFPAALCESSD